MKTEQYPLRAALERAIAEHAATIDAPLFENGDQARERRKAQFWAGAFVNEARHALAISAEPRPFVVRAKGYRKTIHASSPAAALEAARTLGYAKARVHCELTREQAST